MLQAKDLMVGDFVINTDFERNVIDTIDTIEQTRVWLTNGRTYVPIEFISPIPITPKILEKNGFKREGGASYWHEGGRDACIIHWSKDKEQLVIGCPSDDCMVKMNVRYVHEIQNAFRLAGIDKEIVL